MNMKPAELKAKCSQRNFKVGEEVAVYVKGNSTKPAKLLAVDLDDDKVEVTWLLEDGTYSESC